MTSTLPSSPRRGRARTFRSAFTLIELLVAMSILALVLVAFSSGFAVLRDRQSSSTAQTDLRAQAAAALDAIERELVDSAPGYVDTAQRSPTLGSPAGTPSDVFEDPLGGDPAHPRRQALNCTNANGVLQCCRALSALGSSGVAATPGKWLGYTDDPSSPFQGIALTPQMTSGNVCPFCGFPALEPTAVAYTDALLFLTPHDVDRGGWQPQLSTDGTKAIASALVVYAPWIDDRGAGSLRRYTLSWSAIVAQASPNPVGATLAPLLDADQDGVLFRVASPQTYDLGSLADNVFVFENAAAPLNPGRPSIWWQKGPVVPGTPHVLFVFDRESGTAFWDIERSIPGIGRFKSASPAGGAPRTVRTLAAGPGYGCCDFAASSLYSGSQDPIADPRRVRLTIAVGRSYASGIRGALGASGTSLDALVAVASRDVCLRNAP